jgi:hypothetical protein
VVGPKHVVVVEERDPLGPDLCEAAVSCCGHAAAHLVMHDDDTFVVDPLQALARLITGAVVDDDRSHLSVTLGEDASQRHLDQGPAVVRRNDDSSVEVRTALSARQGAATSFRRVQLLSSLLRKLRGC